MTPSFHVIHPPAWMANYQMGFQPSSGDFDLHGRGGPPTVAVGGLLDGGGGATETQMPLYVLTQRRTPSARTVNQPNYTPALKFLLQPSSPLVLH